MRLERIRFTMRVSSISNKLYSKSINNGFKGLWGKSSVTTDIDPVLCIPVTTRSYYYYPFSDESKEQTKKIKEAIDKAEIKEINGQTKYNIEDCRICATFPFTRTDFQAYKHFTEDSKLTDIMKKVHSLVQDKYTNREFGSNPHSAVNSAVEESIKEEERKRRLYF